MKWLALLLLSSFSAAADVPFYVRSMESSRDVSSINENFRSIVGDVTKLRADLDAVPVAVTKSTGFSIVFATAPAFTSSQTSFTPTASVTGSTGSFVVVGSTVQCTLSGSVSNGGGTWVYVGLGVDGRINAVPNTSSSIGLSNQYPATNGAGYPLSFDYEVQVATGVSHAFWFGIWTNSGTNTFPAGSGSVAQFKCREVLSQ